MIRKRYLFVLTLLLVELNAKRFELLSQKIINNGDSIVASGDVVIYSKDTLFRADKAIYYPNRSTIDLIGDVYLSKKGSDFVRINDASYNLKNNNFASKHIFSYDKSSDIWFDADDIKHEGDILRLKQSVISSCDREDPDWKIRFSKGYYHQKKEYISLYNPTFYFKNTPILYLPWFGFPTNRSRKSGFLKPVIGYESQENIFLVTPYYIANELNWDLEIDPQIRVKRGYGVYTNFRFVDTNHSKGSVKLGYFKDNLSYKKRENLKNRSHYGVSIKYKNTKLLSDKFETLKEGGYKDALWIDAIYLNDIDYINLDHVVRRASSKLATSYLNYFLHNERDYLGVYSRYFIDTQKKSNDDTLQTLPYIQFHRYSNIFKLQNLIYSFDYKYKNNYAKEGLNAYQHEFLFPIQYNKRLFGEFLNLGLSENIYYSKVGYYNKKEPTEDATYFSNYHKISLSSDLSKRYNGFVHNIQSEISYTIPSKNIKSGYFAPFIPFNLESKNISFKINQYFYDKSGFDFLYHRLVQTIYKKNSKYESSDLQNQIIYKPKKYIKLQNTLFYSYKYDKIRKVQSDISYDKDRYRFNIDHTYEYKKFDKNSNFITGYGEMKLDRRYNIFASLAYDLQDKFTKEWSVGWKMRKRCWDYMFRYKESVTPNLTSSGAHSTINRGVIFFVRFSPFGGMKYEYNKESELDRSFLGDSQNEK